MLKKEVIILYHLSSLWNYWVPFTSTWKIVKMLLYAHIGNIGPAVSDAWSFCPIKVSFIPRPPIFATFCRELQISSANFMATSIRMKCQFCRRSSTLSCQFPDCFFNVTQVAWERMREKSCLFFICWAGQSKCKRNSGQKGLSLW